MTNQHGVIPDKCISLCI